ncbi:MAG: elongation factor P [Candidatus Moranbacteria bacterium RIFCSPHIGHO2_01_FULL_55_24]|nr:MAG: elongation factor P [Candidatus Moranbacteria bacterium RIFCSPHIGHO2_01_FULL_55_24]
MLGITEIKNGKKVIWNDEPYVVMDYQHSKTGRAGAVLRTKLKNLLTGAIIDHTFQGGDKLEEAEVSKSHAQYLYREGDNHVFMDMESYEQLSIPEKVLGDAVQYLVEGTEVTMLNWNDNAINVELPAKVVLTVTDAPPGIKGDTASGGDKMVTLETGLQITTPLFIKVGDRLIINTEKGTYVSRE